jgi:hypothetical protein
MERGGGGAVGKGWLLCSARARVSRDRKYVCIYIYREREEGERARTLKGLKRQNIYVHIYKARDRERESTND